MKIAKVVGKVESHYYYEPIWINFKKNTMKNEILKDSYGKY